MIDPITAAMIRLCAVMASILLVGVVTVAVVVAFGPAGLLAALAVIPAICWAMNAKIGCRSS